MKCPHCNKNLPSGTTVCPRCKKSATASKGGITIIDKNRLSPAKVMMIGIVAVTALMMVSLFMQWVNITTTSEDSVTTLSYSLLSAYSAFNTFIFLIGVILVVVAQLYFAVLLGYDVARFKVNKKVRCWPVVLSLLIDAAFLGLFLYWVLARWQAAAIAQEISNRYTVTLMPFAFIIFSIAQVVFVFLYRKEKRAELAGDDAKPKAAKQDKAKLLDELTKKD